MAARETKKLTTKKLGKAALASTPTSIAPPAPPPPAPPPPAPPKLEGDWIPVVYEGSGVFSDADAGVFVAGTRTRLRPRIAARLLRADGFRIAA